MKIIAFTLSTALLALGAAPADAARGYRYQDQRSEWKSLGVVQAGGRDDTLTVDRRAGRIDDLRIEATRGSVDITQRGGDGAGRAPVHPARPPAPARRQLALPPPARPRPAHRQHRAQLRARPVRAGGAGRSPATAPSWRCSPANTVAGTDRSPAAAG